jgi:protein phosphatase
MAYVLCTDGINKEMSDEELNAACHTHADPQALLARLFELSLGRAGRDNISAVIVRLQD